MSSSLVTVNVGGVHFMTYRSTLEGSPMLSKLMETSLGNDDVAFFVDRDPSLFAVCLNWMRGVRVLPTDKSALETLESDADYYGLQSLAEEACKARTGSTRADATKDSLATISDTLTKMLLEFKSVHLTVEKLAGSFPKTSKHPSKRRFAMEHRKTMN